MTDCDRLLAALTDGKPHSHHELYSLGMIVHSRISDLRRRGYRIESWRERTGTDTKNRPIYVYRYRLAGSLSAADGTPGDSPLLRTPSAAPSEPDASGGHAPDEQQPGSTSGPTLAPAAPPAQLDLFSTPRTPAWG